MITTLHPNDALVFAAAKKGAKKKPTKKKDSKDKKDKIAPEAEIAGLLEMATRQAWYQNPLVIGGAAMAGLGVWWFFSKRNRKGKRK